MFGRGLEQGQAVIVARETHEGTYRRGINLYAPTGQYNHVYDYVADVEPDSGAPAFRATFTEMFESDEEYRPVVGDRSRVRFHPKDQSVEFDRSALRDLATAAKASGHDRFGAIATAGPGSPAPAASPDPPPPGSGGAEEILRASILIARRKGDEAEAERLTAKLESLGGEPRAAPQDPLDRLAKLADLHERGALTDAEFAAEKAKVLGDA